MKTPMRQVLDFWYSYDINRGKSDMRIFLNKMLKEERAVIVNAANDSCNKYIVDQIQESCKKNNKMFGENYYKETYKCNDTTRDY